MIRRLTFRLHFRGEVFLYPQEAQSRRYCGQPKEWQTELLKPWGTRVCVGELDLAVLRGQLSGLLYHPHRVHAERFQHVAMRDPHRGRSASAARAQLAPSHKALCGWLG